MRLSDGDAAASSLSSSSSSSSSSSQHGSGKTNTPLAVDFACGTVAGAFYTVSAHPFDTVKVAMQSAGPGQHMTALATARAIASGPAGPFGLFRGRGPQPSRRMPFCPIPTCLASVPSPALLR